MATDKTSGKGSSTTLEINDKTIAKSKEVLQSMLEEVKNHAQKKPAETIVKENIETIDKLSKSGVSLPKIYERLNRSIPLGISSASFTQYVRNVRKQVGSELYKELGKRKSKKQVNNDSQAATIVDIATQLESNSTAIAKSGFQCDCCESKAIKYESEKLRMSFWHCEKCNTFYYDDNSSISSKQLESDLVQKLIAEKK